jgi:hypothetical protein
MKFRNITKNTAVSTYKNNLFIAVSDSLVDMIVTAGFSPREARRIILRDVKLIIDEMENEFKR